MPRVVISQRSNDFVMKCRRTGSHDPRPRSLVEVYHVVLLWTHHDNIIRWFDRILLLKHVCFGQADSHLPLQKVLLR